MTADGSEKIPRKRKGPDIRISAKRNRDGDISKMEDLEIEVKFYLANVGLMRNSIIELGADCMGRIFETNVCFEDINKSLIKKKYLLRLRKDTRTRLTFKSEPDIKDKNFKVLKELEVEVSDFSTMCLILESLGFHKEQIYEKWRETFVLNGTTFCIDTMPYGDFLEIEGEKKDIKNFARSIGLQWENRILLNYLAIYDIIKRKLNLSFSDITFSNFKNVRTDLREYLYLIEAGA